MSDLSASLFNLAGVLLDDLHQSDGFVGKNIVFSPLSIATAITMLAGAADETIKEILFAKLGMQEIVQREAFSRAIQAAKLSSSFSIANAVFADKTATLFDDYKAHLTQLHTEVYQVGSLAKSVDVVNDWVSTNTDGLIQNMLSASDLRLAHVVLLNAIAFRQSWKSTFDPQKTAERPFYVTSSDTRPVQMMCLHKEWLASINTPSYQAVKIPYASTADDPHSHTSMIVYLPGLHVPITDVLKSISDQPHLSDAAFHSTKFDVFGFPKFDILSSFSAKDILAKLGYLGSGEFPRMSSGSNEVSQVLHKAYVKVDEQGTTAAAATAVIMARSRSTRPNVLYFDRPFVFTIVKHDPETVLFAGIFAGPSEPVV